MPKGHKHSPEVRARMSEARKRAWAESGQRLPEMTREQRKVYNKLRPIVGREAALAEVARVGSPSASFSQEEA